MKRQTIFLLVLLILVVLLSILNWPSPSKLTVYKPQFDTNADYFFENVQIQKFNDKGLLVNRLKADKLEHYEHSESSYLTNPEINLSSASKVFWLIRAVRGNLNHSANQISLSDAVKLLQTTEPNNFQNAEISILTEQLLFDLNANLATSQTNIILNSADSKTWASNMHADLQSRTIKFDAPLTEGKLNAE